jgi:hypothetical protein
MCRHRHDVNPAGHSAADTNKQQPASACLECGSKKHGIQDCEQRANRQASQKALKANLAQRNNTVLRQEQEIVNLRAMLASSTLPSGAAPTPAAQPSKKAFAAALGRADHDPYAPFSTLPSAADIELAGVFQPQPER